MAYGRALGRTELILPVAMDPREAAQRWADVWERGWHEHDADAIAALYAEGALWQQHPFRPPEPGYLARVFLEEESAECHFGTPIVDRDQAAVPWTAQTRLVDGGTEDLAGLAILRFREDGLVVEHRDLVDAGQPPDHPSSPSMTTRRRVQLRPAFDGRRVPLSTALALRLVTRP